MNDNERRTIRMRDVAILLLGIVIGAALGLGQAQAATDLDARVLRALESIASAERDTAKAVNDLARRCR